MTITNTRAIIDGKLFAMAQITSVQAIKISASRLWPLVMVGIGIVILPVGVIAAILVDSAEIGFSVVPFGDG